MIRVVMLDLGMTLIDAQQRPFAHVPEALAAIAGFKAADGKLLRSCLVSDFTMAEPPNAAQKASALFQQYLTVLAATGLQPFFEPVQQRVTLSTQGGALKPARAVFETALRRLRVKATLAECLFITENAAHIRAARTQLQMQTLRFRPGGQTATAFGDWSQAPALIAHRLGPLQATNLHAAVGVHLAAKGVTLTALTPAGAPGTYRASGSVWHPVALPGARGSQPVQVAVPVAGKVSRGASGALRSTLHAPSEATLAETTAFVAALATHQQIGRAGAAREAGVTHEIVTAPDGQQRLVRKRFSAA